MENLYKLKYLKYREKYLNLKNELGVINNVAGFGAANIQASKMQRDRIKKDKEKREKEELERELKRKQDEFDALPEEEKKIFLEKQQKEKNNNECINRQKRKEQEEINNKNNKMIVEKYKKELLDKYEVTKTKSCGFMGCRNFSSFISDLNNILISNTINPDVIRMIKKDPEVIKWQREILTKRSECKCLVL